MVDEAENFNDTTKNNVESDKISDSQSKNLGTQDIEKSSDIKDKQADNIVSNNAGDAKNNPNINANGAVKFVSSNVENITINLQIVLATKEYKIRELNNLKVSDVIKIGAINDYIFIYANDLAIAKGELINGDEGVVVEIIEIL